MEKRRMPNLPARWLKCPRIGSMMIDLFVPCKTPLDDKFESMIPPEDTFDVENLFEYAKPAQLGVIVDLTKSSRFYHRNEVEHRGCKYVKIMCKGNEETPTPEQVHLFINIVNNFKETNSESRKKIVVHCTHGFNRTGFMIVSYLVEEQNYSLECALKLFIEARPPGIYKADYLKELFERYADPEDCPPAPQLPDWCFEDDDYSGAPSIPKYRHLDSPSQEVDDDGLNITPSSTGNVGTSDRYSIPPPQGQPKLMQGLTGVRSIDQTSFEAHHVREIVDLLASMGSVHRNNSSNSHIEDTAGDEASQEISYQLPEGVDEQNLRRVPINTSSTLANRTHPPRFRGSQPVSMTRQNARLIVDRSYAVTYKSDGTRYLLLIHGPNAVYLIDRANFVYKIESLHFPTGSWLQSAMATRKANEQVTNDEYLSESGGHLVNTLLDGEMVAFDNSPDRPFKFLIYDVLTIQGYPCGRVMPFEQRLNYIEKYVIRPRNDAGHNGFVDFLKQSFSVRKKPFFRLDHVSELLQSTRATLLHETDGLIFQPAGPHDFYVLSTCSETLKWKPPELNTIDFRCKVYLRKAPGEISQYVGELYLGGSRVPNAHLVQVTSKEKSLDGKIVECVCDRISGGWKVLRIRTDKTDPNHISVGKLIMESILFPVTGEDVLSLINMRRQITAQREKEERMKREGCQPQQNRESSKEGGGAH